ncbi:bacteriohemerythrin [Pelobacter seleniigenes]|uniref:bacteriohemerythrin n=1 Tax=Pelobacter seleniigenes TaxID=407188 RepID=UPI0004A6F238|nr:bacteriohemerythrin [Pelobacter seleniigenes]
MSVIEWKEIYATGILVLDNEHRRLIREINRLYLALRDKQGDEILDDVLLMLETYTREHFQHEEALMAEYHYPGLAEHQQLHAKLISAVQELKQRATQEKEGMAQELFHFLRTWLLEHILGVDKRYGPYLESRGGRFIE